ncbi:hypothetical protein FOZ62_005413, partial [Perkinsus olseni]
ENLEDINAAAAVAGVEDNDHRQQQQGEEGTEGEQVLTPNARKFITEDDDEHPSVVSMSSEGVSSGLVVDLDTSEVESSSIVDDGAGATTSTAAVVLDSSSSIANDDGGDVSQEEDHNTTEEEGQQQPPAKVQRTEIKIDGVPENKVFIGCIPQTVSDERLKRELRGI